MSTYQGSEEAEKGGVEHWYFTIFQWEESGHNFSVVGEFFVANCVDETSTAHRESSASRFTFLLSPMIYQ